MSLNRGLKILRERIFINHTTPEDRLITHEFTLINLTNHDIPSVFLSSTEFMLGLKVFDEMNNELPFYTNELTKKLLSKKTEYGKMLEDIEKQKKFVIWIKLNKNSIISKSESKIIKLQYKNRTPSKNLKLKNSFLFTIPHFRTKYSKGEGLLHDIFIIISIPEGYELDYKILTKHKIQTITKSLGCINIKMETKEIELTEEDKVYINENKNITSIRLPPVKESLLFDMIYDVIPEKSERYFYSFFLFSLIGLAIFSTLLSMTIIDPEIIKLNSNFPLLIDPEIIKLNSNFIIQSMYENIYPLLGGIITVAVAAIGFMKSCHFNRTKFWFIIPIVISIFGFLLKDII